MKLMKSYLLAIALFGASTARAQSFDWSTLLGMLSSEESSDAGLGGIDVGSIGDLLNGGGDQDAMMDLVFDAAYLYASSNPEYAVILAALNIHSGDDLQEFLMNDNQNFEDIIAHLALNYANDNPQFSQWFNQVGVTDHASLKKYMKNGKHKDTVNKMALVQARKDDNYSEWLDQLGIEDISDIQELLNGEGGGNVLEKLWPLLEQYVQTNYPEYAQFLPIVKDLLGIGGTEETPEEEVDDPSIDLPVEEEDEVVPPEVIGAFRGLPLSEVQEIQAARSVKKKPSKGLFNFLRL